MDPCLTKPDLDRYHAGELPEAEEGRVRRHLAECEDCTRRDAELVAEHKDLVGRLKGLSVEDGESGGLEIPSPAADRVDHPEVLPETMDLQPGNAKHENAGDLSGVQIEGYEIIRELHRGGQGVVYQAIQKSTKRKVAIKVLLEGPYASKSARRRFEREIELVASLKHPNVISIFHSGQTSDGRQFCVMDYVRGLPIHQYVRDKKLTLEEALKLFAKVCEAVNYAHQKGVIHRDLKPSNILVDSDGAPKVLDFGLAKTVGGPEQTLISMTGQVLGTLPYMSPEQTRANPDEIDIRTDVYALGVILYEMLTGHYPYPVAGQMAEVFKHIAETPPTPPTRQWKADSGVTGRSSKRLRRGQCPIDDEVQTIVLRTLAKERERRYQSAGELHRDIGRYLAGEAIEAKADSTFYVLRKQLRRYRAPVALAAGFVVLVMAFAITVTILLKNLHNEQLRTQQAIDGEREERRLREAQEARERQLVVDKLRDASLLADATLLMDATQMDAHLDGAMELGIDPSIYHTYRGLVYAFGRKSELAMAEENKALALDASNSVAYYIRAALHARANNLWLALADLGKAESLKQGSDIELAMGAFARLFTRDYDRAFADIDKLVDQLSGKPAALWMRGCGRWYQGLRDPPQDINERWNLAQQALQDVTVAAQLYEKLPWVFDVRADLHFRLVLMARVRGQADVAETMQQAARQDAEHLIAINAAAAGHVHLAAQALALGDIDTAAQHAEQAYENSAESAGSLSFILQAAHAMSVHLRTLCAFSQGDDAATRRLARRLGALHPEFARSFEFGVVHGATAERAEVLEERSSLDDPSSGGYGYGVWVGARIRGDPALTAHITERLSVKTDQFSVDLLRRLGSSWSRVLLGFVKGTESEEAVLHAAGNHAGRMGIARLAIAMHASTRQGRIQRLQDLLSIAHPDRVWSCTLGLLYRAEQDPDFLAVPTGQRMEAPTARPGHGGP